MTPWIERFLQFATQPNPRFRCFPAGSRTDPDRRWIATLSHELFPPAEESDLGALATAYGTAFPPEFAQFFSFHDGFTLYRDTLSQAAGFHVAPIRTWPHLGARAQRWFDSLEADEREEALPHWIDDAVVFGEAPHSGNYFLVVLDGNERGRIFHFDHDGFEFDEYASGFDAFLERICTDPAIAVNQVGSPRYSDGETDLQWIPEAYASGELPL